jgi:signal peptidase I
MKRPVILFDAGVAIFNALLLALAIRTFLYQPFNIPAGSMAPTLNVGDCLFVSKSAYGYSRHSFPFGLAAFPGRVWSGQPQRGDVVVFKLPRDPSMDFIKRIVGLPGDEVQMRSGILHINGVGVPKKEIGEVQRTDELGGVSKYMRHEETLPNGVKHATLDRMADARFDNTAVYKVPPGQYFVLGDNRDESNDSRARNDVGFVPFENLVGRFASKYPCLT